MSLAPMKPLPSRSNVWKASRMSLSLKFAICEGVTKDHEVKTHRTCSCQCFFRKPRFHCQQLPPLHHRAWFAAACRLPASTAAAGQIDPHHCHIHGLHPRKTMARQNEKNQCRKSKGNPPPQLPPGTPLNSPTKNYKVGEPLDKKSTIRHFVTKNMS